MTVVPCSSCEDVITNHNSIAAHESNIGVVVNLITLAVLKGLVYIQRETSREGIDTIYRYFDFSVIGTFNITNSLLFISAIDSSFSAYTLYILALFIPIEVNKTLKTAACKRKFDIERNYGENLLHRLIPGFPLAILIVSFFFSTGIQSLEVCDSIKMLLNETKSPAVKFSFINVLSWTFYIPLLIPRRVRNDSKLSWLKYVMLPVTYAIFMCLVLFIPFPGARKLPCSSDRETTKLDEYDMVMATVFRYMYREWDGRYLIFISVAWSMFASLFNPFWYTKRKQEEDSSSVQEKGNNEDKSAIPI